MVLGGLAFNRILLETVASDGSIESGRVRAAIILFQVALLVSGVGVLRRWDRRLVQGGTPIRIIAVVASLSVGLLASEGMIRLVMGPLTLWAPWPTYVGENTRRPSRNFSPDPEIGWRMREGVEIRWTLEGREGTYVANSEGFRSSYVAADLDGAEQLVVLLGDSFTFGTGVDEAATFGALLDEALPRVAVHNLALPGMGLDQMWMVLRHWALPLRPELVVVAFVDHDWGRSLSAFRSAEGFGKPTFVRDKGGLRPATADDAPSAPMRWLERRSYLLGLVRAVGQAIGHRLPVGRWWTTNAAIIDEIVREAREAGVGVVFMRLPTRRADAFPRLSEYLAGRNVSYLDLATPLRSGLHFQSDEHINEAGHAFVAEELEATVRRLLAG